MQENRYWSHGSFVHHILYMFGYISLVAHSSSEHCNWHKYARFEWHIHTPQVFCFCVTSETPRTFARVGMREALIINILTCKHFSIVPTRRKCKRHARHAPKICIFQRYARMTHQINILNVFFSVVCGTCALLFMRQTCDTVCQVGQI